MRVGNVSVQIPEGRERDSGHVELAHEQVYTIRLGNHYHDRRADVKIEVDGKDMGTYRVDSKSNFTLERSSHDDGRFTFLLSDSVEGLQAGSFKVDSADKGLIKVTFKAEKKVHLTHRNPGEAVRTRTKMSHGGLRGLSGDSSSQPIASFGVDTDAYKSDMSALGREAQELTGFSALTETKCSAQNMQAGITGLTGHSNQQFRLVSPLDYDQDEETTVNIRLIGRRAVRELVSAPRFNPVPAPVE